jgi:hypothetical protein
MPTTALGAGAGGLQGWAGAAALGRPTNITSGREEDLPDRSVWLACGRGPSRCWMLPTRPWWILLMCKKSERSEQAFGGHSHSGAKFKPRMAMRGMSLPCVVRLGPRSYAIWTALLWTCLTAPRIIGVARWIDRLTRCPGP